MEVEGRASIDKSRLEQIVQIELNRKEALAKLDVHFATADRVRTSFGYIGKLFLGLLWALIILNDLVKLCYVFYGETKEFLKERRARNQMENKAKEFEHVRIELEDYELKHSKEIENKLEQIHLQLVNAYAKRKVLRGKK
jgi:cell division protein FtsL